MSRPYGCYDYYDEDFYTAAKLDRAARVAEGDYSNQLDAGQHQRDKQYAADLAAAKKSPPLEIGDASSVNTGTTVTCNLAQLWSSTK